MAQALTKWVTLKVEPKARIVCLSDIHGNRAAFESVWDEANLDRADYVIVHGDMVNRGPYSDKVWDMIPHEDPRWILTSGNHERYVCNHLTPGFSFSGPLAEVHFSSAWTCRQLGPRAPALLQLPEGVVIQADGLPDVRVVHASLLGDEKGVDANTPIEYQRAAAAGNWGVLVVGHLHRTYDFQVSQTRVVNAGSVGSACDGIRQAGWAELYADPYDWRVQRGRAEYDLAKAEQDFYTSGFLSEAGSVARLIYEEWKRAYPVVRPWFSEYLDRVLAEELSVEYAVSEYIERLNA